MKRAIASLSILIATVGVAAAQDSTDQVGGAEPDGSGEPPEPVSLEELLDRVEERAPTVLISDSLSQESHWQQVESRMLRMPRFDFSGAIAPVPGIDDENDSRSELSLLADLITFQNTGPWVRGTLDMTVPITTLGKIQIARELADLGVDTADVNRQKAVLEAGFQVVRAYTVLQWYGRVDRVLDEARERLDGAREQLEIRIDEGTDPGARTDLRKLRMTSAELVDRRTEADALARVARSALVAGLGLPEEFRVLRLDETLPEAEPPGLDDVLAVARDQRPDYELLDRAVLARDLQAQLEWRNLRPDFALGGRIGGAWAPTVEDRVGAFVNDPYNNFSFGVFIGMRWNLDIFGRTARAHRFEQQADTARAQREAGWAAIEVDVTQAYEDARGARERLLAYSDAFDAARAWLNQVGFQFEQGFAEYEDLADPLTAYYEEAGHYYQALLEYRIAIASLAVKTGTGDYLSWPGEAVAE